MTEDEQVQAVLNAWEDMKHQIVCDQRPWVTLATRAVRVLTPVCGAAHPQRASIVCDQPAGHVIDHDNEEHRVSWTDAGRTVHMDLGEVVLIADPDREQMTDFDPVASPDLAQMLLGAALRARKALGAVDEKYLSDSKTINAVLIRQVRDAMDQVDAVMREMAIAAGRECVIDA